MYSWDPISEAVKKLRSELGHLAVFFYNEHTPNLIGCLFRPDAFTGQGFSAMHSEYRRPITTNWKENSLVIANASDMMRAVKFIVQDIVVDLKILDEEAMKLNRRENNAIKDGEASENKKRKRSVGESSDDDNDDGSSSDEE